MTLIVPPPSSLRERAKRELPHIMRFHVGEENRITRDELCRRIFGDDYVQSLRDNANVSNNLFDRSVRDAISELRDDELICSSSGQSGYWKAKNMEEALNIAYEYESRARAEEDRARKIKLRANEFFGPQMELPLGG